MSPRPPAGARALLRLLPESHRDFVTGDLEEEYADSVLPEVGRLRADVWFIRQAVRSVAACRLAGGRLARRGFPTPPVLRETRHAFRSLSRRPGFSLLAIAILAVGIGTASSVFSVADAVLFRVVPGVEQPEELATVRFASDDGGEAPVSLANLVDLGEASPGVASIAGYSRALLQVSVEGLPARTAWSQIVTGQYFDLLGVRAARGRLFTRAEADASDGPALVVLSDAFWRRVFQSDPGVIGSALRINGLPFTVVGVVPAGFRGIERLDSLDLWVPASQHVALRHGRGIPGWELHGRAAAHFAGTLIRLAPGASTGETQNQLRSAMANLVSAYPEANAVYREALPTVDAGIGLALRDRERLAPTLKVLAGLVAVILLVTCANVANLLVLRGLRRRGETALRCALGATRTHLVFQNLAEALLLAVPAAILGLAVAAGVNAVLWGTGLFPSGVAKHAAVDGRVFAFATGLGVLTAVTFGLLPALLHTQAGRSAALQAGRRYSSRMAAALQGGLSVSQLALSLALAAAVLLLNRTSANLTRVDPGFSPEFVVAMEVDPGPQGYRGEEVDRFRNQLVERLARLGGIESLAAASFPPFGHVAMQLEIRDPADATRMLTSRADWVTDGFFRTLGVPVVAGRTFSPGEATGPNPSAHPVILGRSLATRLFGTPDRAVGRSVEAAVFGEPMATHVIGVVEDIIDSNLRRDAYPKIYVAMPGSPLSLTTFLVRTRRPMDELSLEVRSILGSIDADVPLESVSRLSDRVADATARERTFARLATLLAGIAILLAGVGLYSVVAFAATQRRREFGIRMAVGASRVGITRLVVRHALAFGIGGVLLGIAIFLIGNRLLASILFGVGAADPLSLAAASGVLLLVTVVASLTPAVGATRVDPAITLRSD